MPIIDALIYYPIKIIYWMIVLRIFLSWVPVNAGSQIQVLVYDLTEPLLSMFRKLFPPSKSGLDFSPMLTLIALHILEYFLLA